MGFAKKPTALGFPIRHRLIIGLPSGSIWGFGGEGEEILPCKEQGLEGLLYGFRIVTQEDSNKSRLHIFIKDLDTEDVDMVSVGFQSEREEYSYFVRTFCLSLCCDDFDYRKPIILTPYKGKKATTPTAQKVVFCSLYQGNKLLKYEWNSDVDCLTVLASLAPNFPAVSLHPSFDENASEFGRSIDEYDDPQISQVSIAWDDLMTRNNAALKRLGWDQEKGREYLLRTYEKKSRHLLSDEQLIEFTKYLESLVDLLETSGESDQPVSF